MIDNMEQYESLGVNCEMGFVLRSAGSTSGGLFRWLQAPPKSVLNILRNGFNGFYVFENLVPFNSLMVWDTVNDIGYHSKMYSKDKQWVHSEDERRAIHAAELERQTFLHHRFQERLRDDSIAYVLKAENDTPEDVVRDIRDALFDLGGRRLLVIKQTGEADKIGKLEEVDRYVIGYLDRFAPSSDANDFSQIWFKLLNDYSGSYSALVTADA